MWKQRNRMTEDEDDFYHADLIGLAVIDTAGGAIGKVSAFHDFGGVRPPSVKQY